ALAYAKLATLPLEYGLYTSFTGVLVYCLFATAKDVTIGPTAVMSQLVGQVLATYSKGYDPVTFAIAIAFLNGIFEIAIGLLRLGIVVDFIPAPVIAGFTTGAGVQIIIGQIPGLLGISGVNTNESTYKVLASSLSKLGNTRLDAAFGFTALFLLITWKSVTQHLSKRGYTNMRYISVLRNAVCVVVFTAISFAVNNGQKTPKVKIAGDVPRGFNHIRAPDFGLLSAAAPAAVTVTIVGILEHVAITKSFGRLNGYRPDANQELVGLGVTNILGSFMGGFSATGSFSRSAIKSQSGVKTPLAGLVTGLVVLLAVYVLTPLFFYIPNAVLSAIIMSAISDLISRPKLLKQLWDIQFIDLFSFILALVFTFFFSIEIAIYVSVGFAVLVLLYRLARPNFSVLGRTPQGTWVSVNDSRMGSTAVEPPEGILVFRPEESLTYPNANYLSEKVKEVVMSRTEYGGHSGKASDRLWCDTTAARISRARNKSLASGSPDTKPLPPLRALILDFSAVNGLDSTGVQTLVDLRRDMDAYAGRRVDLHFAHVAPRLERILAYFLRLTRQIGDVAPVVPPEEEIRVEVPPSSSSSAGPSSGARRGSTASRPPAEGEKDKDLEMNVTQRPPSTTSTLASDGSGCGDGCGVDVLKFIHPSVDTAVACVVERLEGKVWTV
ncbi:hypothetical protein HK104_005720, partial [Borealophlyctis nickersoniae]